MNDEVRSTSCKRRYRCRYCSSSAVVEKSALMLPRDMFCFLQTMMLFFGVLVSGQFIDLPSAIPPARTFSPTIAPSLTPTLTFRPTTTPTEPHPSSSPTRTPLPTISMAPSETPTVAPSPNPTLTPYPTMSPQPSPAPTGPFIVLTKSPTISPTTNSPTETSMPTDSPTISTSPSVIPTLSNIPTLSSAPTGVPSTEPSDIPSDFPTISMSPTRTPQPSISQAPTDSVQPSVVPSESPSNQPSPAPSISISPSSPPSESPSASPTASTSPSENPTVSSMPSSSSSPSSQPTTYPSSIPTETQTPPPTDPFPSSIPSEHPSQKPSFQRATIAPTNLPTLDSKLYTQESILMIVEGFPPGLLSDQEIKEWENITSNFVDDFYREAHESVGEKQLSFLFPWNVTYVNTILTGQRIIPSDNPDKEWLEIFYSQSIEVAIYGDEEPDPDFEEDLFEFPFHYSAFDYMLDFVLVWDLKSFPMLIAQEVQTEIEPTQAPSMKPTPEPESSNLSKRALRTISSVIVVSAILVVAFLFWDRNRREQKLMQEINSKRGQRDNDMMLDFDNAGRIGDWVNPYSDSEQADGGGGGGRVRSLRHDDDNNHNNNVPFTPQDPAVAVESIQQQRTPITPDSEYQVPLTSNSNRSGSAFMTPQRILERVEDGSHTGTENQSSSGRPPMDRRYQSTNGSSRYNAGGGGDSGDTHGDLTGGSFHVPPLPSPGDHHDRHVSVTETVITDITFNDGRSDDGAGADAASDDMYVSGHIPVLQTINSEGGYSTPPDANLPRSPLHIPDSEEEGVAVDLSGAEPPPSPISDSINQDSEVLGLDGNYGMPSMAGFNLQIQDLE